MDETNGTVIIGGGVAGSAIAVELCRLGHKVTLLYRAPSEGSSFTNQKWNHSGLLYPYEPIARKACEEFLRVSLLKQFICKTPSRARFLALHQDTLDERERMWRNWDVRAWGLNWSLLRKDEYCAINPLGVTFAVGGFEVPDCIVDFPRLIEHLRRDVCRLGGSVLSDAEVERVQVEDNRVIGIECLRGSERCNIKCSICVIAAGAWSRGILENSKISLPNLILRKCVVFEYENELVPGLTSCLDVWKHDGTKHDVTLVPFRGVTLAAGTGFTEVISGDDDQPDWLEVAHLTEQLIQCFPGLRNRKPRILTCTKTEKRPGGKPNVSPQTYGTGFHGIVGLTVAIPGKASFMFDLARQVVTELENVCGI
jgi:glycine/D-amino acid oxidase-like deaminating enzyme